MVIFHCYVSSPEGKIAGDFPFQLSSVSAKELMPEAPDVEETSKNLPWKCRSLVIRDGREANGYNDRSRPFSRSLEPWVFIGKSTAFMAFIDKMWGLNLG